MRRSFSLLLLPALLGPTLVGPAFAEDPPKAEAHHARQTWEQHFVQANLTHDGHLTQAEAKGGFAVVSKHFDDIDADHKGYVTENDIRAWRAMRKAAHRLAHPPADKLKPQHAFHLQPPAEPLAPTVLTASVPARVPPAVRATRVDE
jgi:hypothetical protein